MTTIAAANITAQNQFTTAVRLEGYFNLSLRGPTFTGTTTVTVQRSIDNVTWTDVSTFTAPTEEVGFEPELMWYRVGVKSGEFTASDDINIRLGREDRDRH
jgi:hypothetical protein